METKLLLTSAPNAIQTALETLRAGELVAFPTDTVYGIGTFAFNAEGATKIYAAKKRPPDKALPILLGDVNQIPLVAVNLPEAALKLAEHFLPGALTLIVPKHLDIPEEVSSLETIGIRIPDHDFARALLIAAGPMAVNWPGVLPREPGVGSALDSEEKSRRSLVGAAGGRDGPGHDGGAQPGRSADRRGLHAPPGPRRRRGAGAVLRQGQSHRRLVPASFQ